MVPDQTKSSPLVSRPALILLQLSNSNVNAERRDRLSKLLVNDSDDDYGSTFMSSPTSTLASSFTHDFDSKITLAQCQPAGSIVNKLPVAVLREVVQYVDQFDLTNLARTCSQFYPIATERLYQRVTIIINAQFPVRYGGDSDQFIRDNGIKFMDSALILTVKNLLKFIDTISQNLNLLQKIKFFVFDKCYTCMNHDINMIQTQLIEFMGNNSNEISFLHITFIDFLTGISKLTNFLLNDNIRNKIFKLFVTTCLDLFVPTVPQGLTNLFLMLDELELMDLDNLDLSTYPFDVFNSLFTLTCSTNNQFGLEILKKMALINNDIKLKLKGFTLFHCHKENLVHDEDMFSNIHHDNPQFLEYIDRIDKSLNFDVLESKIDIANLSLLYLKLDCYEHRTNHCTCFQNFFKRLTQYSYENGGLPNLACFELELYPNFDWLRPHQILENILTPVGEFVQSLTNLSRLTIDFLTPAFKMFDHSIRMSSSLLNKLNERLMDAFFYSFFTDAQSRLSNESPIKDLKTLQLPDFLTSFIYYKPDFYQSLLHTCKCWGCQLVLEKLKESFFPLYEPEEDEDDLFEAVEGGRELDDESAYYILIGFILGKSQADREVCIPIKQLKFNYRNYPIYKGQPHTLHNHYHHRNDPKCKCDVAGDPGGLSDLNIDTLVTTYLIHQLDPIVRYISKIFQNLDNLMVHGIYYEYDEERNLLLPIFDADEYPAEFLRPRAREIVQGIKPKVPFGHFKRA